MPLVSKDAISIFWDDVEDFEVKFRGKVVCVAAPLKLGKYDGWQWYNPATPFDMFVASPGPSLSIVPLWHAFAKQRVDAHGLNGCNFPPRWKSLCGVRWEDKFLNTSPMVWNRDHPLFRSINSDGLEWCRRTFSASLDPLPQKKALLSEKARCAAWVLLCLVGAAADLWDGLTERDVTFLPALWGRLLEKRSKAARPSQSVICYWIQELARTRLVVISPEGWHEFRRDREKDVPHIEHHLPDPGPDWRLDVEVTYKKDPSRPWLTGRRQSSAAMPKPHWWYL